MFLVPQLQNDTSTEYRILKSILQVLFLFIYGVCIIVCAVWPVPMFPWVGMKEEVEPLPLAFQYLILMLTFWFKFGHNTFTSFKIPRL